MCNDFRSNDKYGEQVLEKIKTIIAAFMATYFLDTSALMIIYSIFFISYWVLLLAKFRFDDTRSVIKMITTVILCVILVAAIFEYNKETTLDVIIYAFILLLILIAIEGFFKKKLLQFYSEEFVYKNLLSPFFNSVVGSFIALLFKSLTS
ncbi:MAG: hypothetical protein ACK4VO_13180 [Pseudobdellovibrio sp.]